MPTLPITSSCAGYPASLWARQSKLLGRRPTIFCRGHVPDVEGIAVVGTREATAPALKFTGELCRHLVSLGWTIWSGGARGIDHAAHSATLSAGGRTWVVMAGGLDDPYPKGHRQLYERVVTLGGLISLQPDQARRNRGQFLRRNHLLAALTHATIVIECPFKSGTRSTAAAARVMNRSVYVVPHPPWNERGSGCLEEIALGGIPIADVARLGKQLGPPPGVERGQASLDFDASSDAGRKVRAALGRQAQHVDGIIAATGLPASTVTHELLILCLTGSVQQSPPGHYRLS